MLKNKFFGSLVLATALIGGVATTTNLIVEPAVAQQSDAKSIVDKAKSDGLIGETSSGYLAVVTSAPREVVNAMNEINIRRKSLYTQLAREQNVQIEVVAALTGEKVLAGIKSGEKFMDDSGQWNTKR